MRKALKTMSMAERAVQDLIMFSGEGMRHNPQRTLMTPIIESLAAKGLIARDGIRWKATDLGLAAIAKDDGKLH